MRLDRLSAMGMHFYSYIIPVSIPRLSVSIKWSFQKLNKCLMRSVEIELVVFELTLALLLSHYDFKITLIVKQSCICLLCRF